jgi:cytochrome P450
MQASMKAGTSFFYRLAEDARDHGQEDSFSRQLFRIRDEHKLSDREVSSISGNLFAGGTETSSSTLISFILAMCAFPEVAAKAQEEIDRVVGHNRSPTFEDDLPYVRALVSEVFRWRSTAIIGGQPHAPIQDDYYKGYLIPRDTLILGNLYAIHHNMREFPEPDKFMPERFFDGNPFKRPFPSAKGYMTFGWGKRVCSGQPFAEQGIYITVARNLWGFNIRNSLDDKVMSLHVFCFHYTILTHVTLGQRDTRRYFCIRDGFKHSTRAIRLSNRSA